MLDRGNKKENDGVGAGNRLDLLSDELKLEYGRKQRLLSFQEYMGLVAENPLLHTRNAAQYLKDAFEHFGHYDVHRPGGKVRRFRLFDCEFDGGRGRLVGQEGVQNEIYRILDGFVAQGRINKLLLLHGPNGSSKSTCVDVISRGLKHYSTLEQGATYRFNWVFPTSIREHGGIGFSPGRRNSDRSKSSYAHLNDTALESRLTDELRDHPLMLIPTRRRREILEELLDKAGVNHYVLSDYILHGDLNHRNRQIFESLLAAYHGDYSEVLRHVQVERYFLSRRYRIGLVAVEPKMSVDAHTRLLTMDRNLANLPPVLQNLSLVGYAGELVDANRGIIDFSDLLKRPVEAFKYLINMVESGRVTLDNALLYTDTVFFGSTNELHLAAFRELPDFASFRGRMELVRVPYMLDHRVEAEIYSSQLSGEIAGKHIAPHAVECAALWAVLIRLHQPDHEKYPEEIREEIKKLNPLQKARLYSEGVLPDHVSGRKLKILQNSIEDLAKEYTAGRVYEGSTGASPRVVLTVLFNSIDRGDRTFLSPLAVLDEIRSVCEDKSLYDFLRREPHGEGFFNHSAAIEMTEQYLLHVVEKEMWDAVGLVEEQQMSGLLKRYVTNAACFVKDESLRNAITGKMEKPDEKLMEDVEKKLGADPSEREAYRNDIITRIAAWALAHKEGPPVVEEVFAREMKQLKDRVLEERRDALRRILVDTVRFLDGTTGQGPEKAAKKDRVKSEDRVEGFDDDDMVEEVESKVVSTIDNLVTKYGYNRKSAREAIGFYLAKTAGDGGKQV